MNIIVYETATGTINRCVTCPHEMAQEQCRADESYIEHDLVDDSKYKIDLETLEVVLIDPE